MVYDNIISSNNINNMNIPKTLVIGINMHGEIHLKENGSICKDNVPENLKITTISVVAPGVPNVSTLDVYEEMASTISKQVNQQINWDNLSEPQIISFTESIRDLLVDLNKEQVENIIKDHQHLYMKNEINPVLKTFSHNYEHSFRITTSEPGELIPDKLFLKFTPEEVNNPDNVPHHYFNKIVLYNLEDEPDLFDMLQSVDVDIDEITLVQLMEFIVNIGVENLIMVDLSCSIFKGEEKFLSPRNIRHMRQQMLKDDEVYIMS